MNNDFDNSNAANPTAAALPQNYQPNADELQVLAECRTESTMNGAVSAAVFGAITWQSIVAFKLSRHSKYGVFPKVSAACLFGFIFGKIRSIPSCYEKLKNLPNSPIGEIIRRKKGGQTELLPMATGMDPNLNFSPVAPPKFTTDGPMNSALDLDVYSPPSSLDSYTGDELNGLEYNGPMNNFPEQHEVERQSVSYAELRQRNRENYVKTQNDRHNVSGPSANNETPAAVQPPRRPSPPASTEQKNEYGDVWG